MSNHITISGNLGRDPELTYSRDGVPRVAVSVACTPRRKNPNTQEWEDDGLTQWYRATVFGNQAEDIAAFISKGDRVTVSGTLVHRDYQDNTGQARVSHEIKYATITRHAPRQGAPAATGQPNTPTPMSGYTEAPAPF